VEVRKIKLSSQAWLLTPVILHTWEAKIGRIEVQGQHGSSGRVSASQVQDSEFKTPPKKKKKKRKKER
jgi:hypothetical protein